MTTRQYVFLKSHSHVENTQHSMYHQNYLVMKKHFLPGFLFSLFSLLIAQPLTAQNNLSRFQKRVEKAGSVIKVVVEKADDANTALRSVTGQPAQQPEADNTRTVQAPVQTSRSIKATSSGSKTASPTISSFHPDFQITLDSCKGDRNSQVVTLYFRIRHQRPHQQFSILVDDNRTQAFDNEGLSRQAQSATIAGQRANYTASGRAPTNISIPCTITIANVVDFKNPMLQSLFIHCVSQDANGASNYVSGEIEVNNLTIDWD